MAVLIGVMIGALMGAMVALPIANNARLRQAYPRAIMNLMEHDYDLLSERAAQGLCTLADDPTLARLRSLAVDTPAAFKAQGDEQFVAANQALLDALEAVNTAQTCADLENRLDQVDRQCESCHSDYR